MIPRILVAVVAIPIIIIMILLPPVWVLGILCGAGAAVSAWEFLQCTLKHPSHRFAAYAAVVAFCIPFLCVYYSPGLVHIILMFLLLVVTSVELMLSFRKKETLKLDCLTLTLIGGCVFPIMLSTLVLLGLREHGGVYALLPFVVCFSSDSGAYFAGVFLGKHPLTPRLSPKKTLEGSAGGFVAAILFTLLYGLILSAVGYTVRFAVMGVYGYLGSLASQAGDLSFSAVKRLCGVKDYGKLIPGHGGMLDRLDSIIWAAPLLYLLVLWVPAITK